MSPAQQKAVGEATSLVDKVNTIIFFPLIALLMAVAFLMFLLGCAEYIMNAANSEARSKGIKHITWGIIGLVVMVSAWAILRVAAGTIGLGDELKCADDPTGSGCDKAFEIKSDK